MHITNPMGEVFVSLRSRLRKDIICNLWVASISRKRLPSARQLEGRHLAIVAHQHCVAN
jgi:hypothetical protein